MAPRTPNGQPDLTQDNDNQQLVLDNLGMTPNELGMDQDDSAFDPPDDGDDNELGQDLDLDRGQSQDRQDDFELPPTRQQQQQRTQRREQDDDQRVTHTLHSQAEVKADKNGNLVNAQGVIVARAGKEARLYQKANTESMRATRAETAVREVGERFNQLADLARTMSAQLNEYRTRETELKKYNMTPEEDLRSRQIFLELRDNPQQALQKLLTRASANGIDLTKLGIEGGSHAKSLVDLVRGEIQQAVAPIRQREQTEQQREQAQRVADEAKTRAETELTQFLGANPEAREYLPAIGQILSNPAGKGMSLDHVWSKIQLNLLQNPRQRQPNSRRNLPSGRGAPSGGNTDTRRASELAPIETSYDQIIMDAFKS